MPSGLTIDCNSGILQNPINALILPGLPEVFSDFRVREGHAAPWHRLGVRVLGCGVGVGGSLQVQTFRFQISELRIQDVLSGFKVLGSGFRVWGLEDLLISQLCQVVKSEVDSSPFR